MEESLQNQNYAIIVQQAISEKDNYKRLRLVHTCLHFIQLESKKFDKFHHLIDKLITNVDYIRRLEKNQNIKSNDAMAVEYLGKDFLGGDTNFLYDEEFENNLNLINQKMDEYLAAALIEVTKSGDQIEFGTG